MRFKLWDEISDSGERFLIEKLRSKKGVQMILKEVAQDTSDGYHYLVPWKLLDEYRKSCSDEVTRILTAILRKV
jgi:hypothetical protein